MGSTVPYRTPTRVVPDPNDQTFDHQNPDHQTFDDPDPGAGGAGGQRACMYRYQGPMRHIGEVGPHHMLMSVPRVRSSDDLGVVVRTIPYTYGVTVPKRDCAGVRRIHYGTV